MRTDGDPRGMAGADPQPMGVDRDRGAGGRLRLGEGLHVCEDEVVLERVDDDGVPVGADEPAARTLATGLANRTFPFIRYDLGDQVEWLPGSVRVRQRVRARGGHRRTTRRRFPVWSTTSARKHFPSRPRHRSAVSEYQVAQTVEGADVLIVGNPGLDALKTSLIAALRRYGLPDPTVEIGVVDRIPRHHATGKLKRFIPLSTERRLD